MKKFGIYKPLLKYMATLLVVLSVSRLILSFIYFSRVYAVPDWYRMFTLGVRMDMIMIGYLCFIPAVFLFLLPDKAVKKISWIFRWYFILTIFYMVFMELVTVPFVNEYDTRPNRLFVDYLQYPHEVASMLVKGFTMDLIVVSVLSVIIFYFLIKLSRSWMKFDGIRYGYKLAMFPFAGALLFLFARSSFSPHPASPGTAAFASDQLVNSLALNSGYSLATAIHYMKDEKDVADLYGKMDFGKALPIVKKDTGIADSLFVFPEETFSGNGGLSSRNEIYGSELSGNNNVKCPLLHRQRPLKEHMSSRPYNLVIMLQESLGAEFVGALGGLKLTPNIDSLAREGQLFTNLYCTGTRSVRGIEAMVSGFPPTPSRSVVKLGKSQTGFFTMAELLGRLGYHTSFIYGGMASFDNMSTFFTGNGFDSIIDEKDFKNYVFKGTWGVSDEDLMRKADEVFKGYGNEPFFSMVFSSSNHTPFMYPDGRITLYDKDNKYSLHNAVKYADYSLGLFFRLAEKSEYYRHTIFIIVADHNTRTYGDMLVPIHKFHIPALIIGPGVPKEAYTKLCSQLDMAPTLLDYMGVDNENPMPGRDLCQLPDSIPGRAIMQFYQINAYMEESRTKDCLLKAADGYPLNGCSVLIMQPKKKPASFIYDQADSTLVPSKIPDWKMALKALSLETLMTDMYNARIYDIPSAK
ncbi:MAG: LTA synthase family protein [Bacteroidales bacterium]|jgi:phosphoglycerol transferase MdoB-like AlkP superfamily enzyme|nr:LTA synthase family protein [Bacteroidales bacterium]